MFHATGLTGWQRAGLDAAGVAEAPHPPQHALPTEELEELKAQAAAAAATLEHVRQRIDELAAGGVPAGPAS